MRYVFFCSVIINIHCFSQEFYHEDSLSLSKTSILSTEQFSVTYFLATHPGHYYIGIKDDYFETVGKGYWEGDLKENETVKVSLNVRLKQKVFLNNLQPNYLFTIGFAFKPFGENHPMNVPRIAEEGIHISLKDYKELLGKKKKTSGWKKIGPDTYEGSIESISPNFIIKDSSQFKAVPGTIINY